MTVNQLSVQERIAAGMIASSFLLVTLYTFLLAPASMPNQSTPSAQIEVSITGAVQNPGEYQLPQGATLSCLLDRAQPARDADLSRMRKQRKLTHGEELIIPSKKHLTIYLNGKQIEVPKGTRVCDLILWTDLDPQQAAQLTSKRRLKDGERL